MNENLNLGWLKDSNGDKFAPKTLISQVQASDGTSLDVKIQADIDALKGEFDELLDISVEKIISKVLAALPTAEGGSF